MRLSRRLLFLGFLAVFAAAAIGGTTARSAPTATGKTKLITFGTCGQLLDYAKGQTKRFVGPYGFGGRAGSPRRRPRRRPPPAERAAPVQGVDYSGTNVQEEGVDEPDLVKTDGKTLFTVAGGKLRAVDVSGAKPRLLDSLALEPGMGYELLLHGDRLLVLSNGGYWIEPLPAIAARASRPPARRRPFSPRSTCPTRRSCRLVRTLTLDGSYVAARLVGSACADRHRRADPEPPCRSSSRPTARQEALEAAKRKNEAVVASSKVARWLPSYRIKRAGAKADQGAAARAVPPRAPPDRVLRARDDDDAHRRPRQGPRAGRLGRGDDRRPHRLRLAGEPLRRHRALGRPARSEHADEAGERRPTEIHKFDISSPVKTHYRGSGTVSGYLLNQWSLSEYRGVLRVVSTETPAWWGAGGESESFLTTLRPSGGSLVQAGRIGELGKGERVYAVRFVGDTGFVVTFRQVDPLYTLDLSSRSARACSAS